MPSKSRSALNAEEHQRHVGYHGRQAAEHDAADEPEAAAKHRVAKAAHEESAASPLDEGLSKLAMRSSAMADEISLRVRKLRNK